MDDSISGFKQSFTWRPFQNTTKNPFQQIYENSKGAGKRLSYEERLKRSGHQTTQKSKKKRGTKKTKWKTSIESEEPTRDD